MSQFTLAFERLSKSLKLVRLNVLFKVPETKLQTK